MAELVDPKEIENIVGIKRHQAKHYARAVSAEQMVYILHPQVCLDSGVGLLQCPYSLALNKGIDLGIWPQNRPVWAMIGYVSGKLEPVIA